MENELAQLTINEEEDDVIQIQENPGTERTEEFLQLVGCFLTASIIHFPAMKRKENRNFMRIRVQVDIRRPLKRKNLLDYRGRKSYVRFKYERLTLFYFYCGKLGHNDSFCEAKMLIGVEIAEMGWDLSIRAQSRRALSMNSVWLREEAKRAIGGIHEGNRGFARGLQRMECNKSFGKAVDPILGFNVEGDSLCEDEKQVNSLMDHGHYAMEHDLEDVALAGEE
ncbi:hypothetical protein Gotur_025766, partial [Gossypium turneri]